jgi:hypothetical protein
MTPQEYLSELARRFYADDARGAYALWCERKDERLDLGLSADDKRRLRGLLHIVLQMAAELGWESDRSIDARAASRTV